MTRSAAIVLAALGLGCGDNTRLEAGEMTVLTYNVAGLPQDLSGSDPEQFMPLISPLLNDFDIALVQEDFWYHAELTADIDHPSWSTPYRETPTISDIGDGLNRFSRSRFEDHRRIPWGDCEGFTDCASDCLATKGFSVATHHVGRGIEIDVYNLHNEAGGCPRDLIIREASATLLISEIARRSANRPVVVAGDFNLHADDPLDRPTFDRILAEAGLIDACWQLDCQTESIDRVLIRGTDAVDLEVVSWSQPEAFVDGRGQELSDHLPTAATVRWVPSE